MTLLHLGPRQAACTALIRLAQMWQKRFQVLVCSFCEFHTPKGKMILTKYLIWKLLLIQMCHLWPPHPLPHPLCLSHKRLFSAITKVLQVHPFDLLWKTQFRNASLSLVSPLFFFPWEHQDTQFTFPSFFQHSNPKKGITQIPPWFFGLPELSSYCCSHHFCYFRAVSPAQGFLPTRAECHYERRLLWAATITGNLSLQATSIMDSFTKWLWVHRALAPNLPSTHNY